MNKQEERLLNEMAKCARDPYRFVLIAFQWGEGELEGFAGPSPWQAEVLKAIGAECKTGCRRPIQIAVSSGKGIGKSCLMAWIILWAMSTRPLTRGRITAETMPQLLSVSMPELQKWHKRLICKDWFEMAATSIYKTGPESRNWRFDAMPWNETNPEAFAGFHNKGTPTLPRRLVMLMDEASAIPDVIWNEADGILTDKDTEVIWCAFGNPTKNLGRFKECFERGRRREDGSGRWLTWQVDSRTVPMITNRAELDKQVEEHGEDSDYVRVRIRGVFPRAGFTQFISGDAVEAAMSLDRDAPATIYDPLVIGVDVAAFGDDATVIWFRRGRDARSIPAITFRGIDPVSLQRELNDIILHHKPQGVFIDAGGGGQGVAYNLRSMGHRNIYDIDFGGNPGSGVVEADGRVAYFNKRAEMWGILRDWIPYGMLPFDRELLSDLTGVQFDHRQKQGREAIILESKKDMKKRGVSSPDRGDALALTFAIPMPQADYSRQFMGKPKHEHEYEPLSEAWAAGGVKQGPTNPSRAWMPGQAKGW